MVLSRVRTQHWRRARPGAADTHFWELTGDKMPAPGTAPTNPEDANEVGRVLLEYLSRRLRCSGLDFKQQLAELCDGWETYTFAFQLKHRRTLPKQYSRPLILRIYSNHEGIHLARHEFAVQRHLAAMDYPVPRHYFLEEDCGYFGGPFLVSLRVPGRPLLDSMVARPWLFGLYAERMASIHARLHRLPLPKTVRPASDYLSRRLAHLGKMIDRYSMVALRPGLNWLHLNRPKGRDQANILHLDFHPLNLLQKSSGDVFVIDWTQADVGDFHADVGQTLMILDCMPDDRPGWFEQLCVDAGRWGFSRWYLKAYRRQMAVEMSVLRYYQALAALRRLVYYGQWLSVGATMNGCKACAIRHLRPDHFHHLEAYFRKWSGVQVAIEPQKSATGPMRK